MRRLFGSCEILSDCVLRSRCPRIASRGGGGSGTDSPRPAGSRPSSSVSILCARSRGKLPKPQPNAFWYSAAARRIWPCKLGSLPSATPSWPAAARACCRPPCPPRFCGPLPAPPWIWARIHSRTGAPWPCRTSSAGHIRALAVRASASSSISFRKSSFFLQAALDRLLLLRRGRFFALPGSAPAFPPRVDQRLEDPASIMALRPPGRSPSWPSGPRRFSLVRRRHVLKAGSFSENRNRAVAPAPP